MSGIEPVLQIVTQPVECAFILDDLPFASLVCRRRDGQCLAVSRSFMQLTGRGASELRARTLEETVIVPGNPCETFGCRAARLRCRDGEIVKMSMLGLPAILAGEPAMLLLFLSVGSHRWRKCDLATAIDGVIRDDMEWFSGAVLERLANGAAGAGRACLQDLTKRERQVLRLVCEGRDDAYIALELTISRNTVRNHLANIYAKANVNKRSELVVWAHQRGVAAA